MQNINSLRYKRNISELHILIWETGIDDIFSDVMIGLFRWKILMDSDML